MCGVAGCVVAPRNNRARQFVESAVRALGRRGPDGNGIYEDGRATYKAILGHTRLAIIDPHERSAQPFVSNSGRTVISYNGEIYNYKKLKGVLRDRGRSFRTDSDTEVIVEAYESWGSRFLERLRGMYAFALYDAEAERVILGRDRIGIKPLFVAFADDDLWFSSELDALGHAQGEMSKEALAEFTRYGFIGAPRTAWSNIFKVPAGEAWCIDCSERTIERNEYWTFESILPEGRERRVPTQKEVERRVVETVGVHLESDVPVTLLLSGGIDSALIAWSLKRLGRLDDVVAYTHRTGKGDSDARLAGQTAETLGIRHIYTEGDAQGIGAAISGIASLYGNPLADTSAIRYDELCKQVGSEYKVALGGDGGDEAFLGYKWDLAWKWLSQLPAIVHGERAGFKTRWYNYLPEPLETICKGIGEPPVKRYETLHGYPFSLDEVFRLTGVKLRKSAGIGKGYGEGYTWDIQARVKNISHFTTDAILYKVDVASMGNGLEVRVPFLDHQFLEWAVQLDPKVLARGLTGKRIIRQTLRGRLPDNVVSGAKRGFGLQLRGMLEELVRLAKRDMWDGCAVGLGIIDGNVLREIIDNRQWRLETKLYTLLILEHWLREHH